ncbi:hypothetical protein NP233_g9535 [Leucocoprinus birnbaumii]|uniref:Uncharacterized protein n=1 Tax=Leucocoprinus birnbaumii TaxID=56174 RepID=A0AAD5VKV6_9AGAR|nr:hypothetical protein NP233_g9535 [Leucocoprinus birnbaumii]
MAKALARKSRKGKEDGKTTSASQKKRAHPQSNLVKKVGNGEGKKKSKSKKTVSALGDTTNTTSLKITIPVLQPRTSFQLVGNIQNTGDNTDTINVNNPDVGRVQVNGEVPMDVDIVGPQPRNILNPSLIPQVVVPQTNNMNQDSQLRGSFVQVPVPIIAAPPDNPVHVQGGNTISDDLIDPLLRNASVAPPASHSQAPPGNAQSTPQPSPAQEAQAQNVQSNEGEGEGEDGWCSDDPDDLDDDEEAPKKKKKSQKDKEKGDYGFILGLMRGNDVLEDVKRPRALPKPLTKSSFMSRRFRRALPLIVAHLEALAHQTGCWIYLAAQHTTAVNPFVHYVSPRLKREGASQLNQIHAQVSKLMRSLIESRRAAVTEKNMELEETQAKLDDASKQLMEQEKKLQRQQELIDRLMAGQAQ